MIDFAGYCCNYARTDSKFQERIVFLMSARCHYRTKKTNKTVEHELRASTTSIQSPAQLSLGYDLKRFVMKLIK